MLKPNRPRRLALGFSLVELMVAMVLGLIVIGAVIALVPTAQNAAIAQAVARAFAEAGYPRPQLFTVTPCAGARRER